MSVHDAEPGDIYTDERGKLWRIVAVCHQPTVEAEEVEGTLYDPNVPQAPNAAAAAVGINLGQFGVSSARINKQRKSGGTNGLMWNGWKRIWRKP
jgi:hypothetical protein